MAQNSSDGVTWYMRVPMAELEMLGTIRHWENLKIGMEGPAVWVKDFTVAQIESLEVKIIPHKEIFYSNGPKLFPYGSALPAAAVPALLWSPIERGIHVSLPAFNHNYFGVQEKVEAHIVRTSVEEASCAMLVGLNTLGSYLEVAPSVRTERLSWVIIDDKALLIGTPLLPVNGNDYWSRGNHLLPAGFDFRFPVLAPAYESLLSPVPGAWLLWNSDSQYTLIPKSDVQPFSLSAFRNTFPVQS